MISELAAIVAEMREVSRVFGTIESLHEYAMLMTKWADRLAALSSHLQVQEEKGQSNESREVPMVAGDHPRVSTSDEPLRADGATSRMAMVDMVDRITSPAVLETTEIPRKTMPMLDLATLEYIHNEWEFADRTEEQFDEWMHGLIRDARKREGTTETTEIQQAQFWCATCGASIHQYGTTLVKLGDGTFICRDCFYKQRDTPKP